MNEPKTDIDEKKNAPSDKDKPIPPELAIETHHVLPDGTRYVATAATLHVKNGDGDPIGEVFHTIYTRGERLDRTRPILFAFNGGPGSASAWLHLGAWGPMRAEMPDPEFPKPPPYARLDG